MKKIFLLVITISLFVGLLASQVSHATHNYDIDLAGTTNTDLLDDQSSDTTLDSHDEIVLPVAYTNSFLLTSNQYSESVSHYLQPSHALFLKPPKH